MQDRPPQIGIDDNGSEIGLGHNHPQVGQRDTLALTSIGARYQNGLGWLIYSHELDIGTYHPIGLCQGRERTVRDNQLALVLLAPDTADTAQDSQAQ